MSPGVAATARDSLLAVLIVASVLGGAYLYAGSWPPILVVESGSMMHCDARAPGCDLRPAHVPYGRFGTLDPGDIVVQKRVRDRDDVRTWAEGGAGSYGKPGDVIVFYPFNNTNRTPIIHRAMAWVDVVDSGREYRVEWTEGSVRTFGPSGIYLPELGFDERAGFEPDDGYRPRVSGFITKGDNVVSNDRADQAAANAEDRLTELVQVGWIAGKARGELPWFGLVKLVFTNGRVNQPNPAWMRVGNAFAPYDEWTMLGFCIALIVLAPLTLDVWRAWREQRAVRRDLERASKRRPPSRDEDVPAFETVD